SQQLQHVLDDQLLAEVLVSAVGARAAVAAHVGRHATEAQRRHGRQLVPPRQRELGPAVAEDQQRTLFRSAGEIARGVAVGLDGVFGDRECHGTEASMEIDTGTTELLCSVEGGVALITLNRPEARNAMSDKLTPALRTQIRERGEDPDVGAILITGAGTAFCSGGDVKGMGGRGPRGQMTYEERLGDLRWRQAALTGALVGLRKPTIAALPGAAAGAGLAIALACDIRIAARSAFVSTGYARVGLSGDYGIAWLLTRAVGSARARELMFTAERVDAERCERIGLVNRLVDDG